MSRRSGMMLSSVGKKQLMAVTGLAFVGFLLVHLAGNLNIFLGAHALNRYGETLESFGALILFAELGLATTLLVHAVLGATVVLRNLPARGVSYEVSNSSGGRSLGARTMWLTGPWILAFIVVHVLQFAIPYKLEHGAVLSEIVAARLHDPIWASAYGITMLAVALHVSHGLWSGLQTLGLAPSRRGPTRAASLLVAIAFAAGFGSLAACVYWLPEILTRTP
jgi:succinate dehydrogenase / fumarate reductase, cytochrome b subunit